jgi:hypothetical protein
LTGRFVCFYYSLLWFDSPLPDYPDGPMRTDAATPPSADSFLTPPRILIPKLVRSRDGWKRRAGERKRRMKTLTVRVRDLEASRARWKERARQAQTQLEQLQRQLRDTPRLPEPLPVPQPAPPKISTPS